MHNASAARNLFRNITDWCQLHFAMRGFTEHPHLPSTYSRGHVSWHTHKFTTRPKPLPHVVTQPPNIIMPCNFESA